MSYKILRPFIVKVSVLPNKQVIQNFLKLLELMRTFENFCELWFSIVMMGTFFSQRVIIS